MEKWEGQVAVVTGASAGIGKAIAIKLAEEGMTVAALARREDILKEIADNFKGKGSIKGYKCDITSQSDVENIFNLVLKDLGQVRVLVNNAGVSTCTHILDFDMNKWRQMFDVNVFGMFTCIKQVFEAVKSNNESRLVHIFNINSIVGHFPAMSAETQIYAATKQCVTALSRGLLKQFGIDGFKNIRITSLSPGVVDTEIFDVGGWKGFDIAQLPYLKPEAIADALLAALMQPDNVVNKMDNWEGEVAIVTGASSGIGKAIAIKLAEQGMKVAALARREEKLYEVAKTFTGKGLIKAYKCDVIKKSEIKLVFERISRELGQIRVLVNNAGLATCTHILDFAMDKWREMFEVNVFGMFTCVKYFVDTLRRSHDTRLYHIFNINSIYGHLPATSAKTYLYVASKHTVTLLTQGLLKQMGIEGLKNIRITSLSPGYVDTEIFNTGGWNQMDITKMSHLTPEEVANTLVFALGQPENVIVSEITVKPAGEKV